MHVTLCGMILLALPTSNNFVQFVFAKILGESAGGRVQALLVLFSFLAIAIYQNSPYLYSGLLISGHLLPLKGNSCAFFVVCV